MKMPQSLIQAWEAFWHAVCHGLYACLALSLLVSAVVVASFLPSPRSSVDNEAWQWDPPH